MEYFIKAFFESTFELIVGIIALLEGTEIVNGLDEDSQNVKLGYD